MQTLSEPVRHKWQAHLDGTASDQYRPWLVMKVQAWLEAQGAHQGLFSCAAAA